MTVHLENNYALKTVKGVLDGGSECPWDLGCELSSDVVTPPVWELGVPSVSPPDREGS